MENNIIINLEEIDWIDLSVDTAAIAVMNLCLP
jgi:hypothetical protein